MIDVVLAQDRFGESYTSIVQNWDLDRLMAAIQLLVALEDAESDYAKEQRRKANEKG